jgi:hypothetical protein
MQHNIPVEKTPIPLLLPRFWWLVLNTVLLKHRHKQKGDAGYSEYLNQFYAGDTTNPHVEFYGDAYHDVRSSVIEWAELEPGDSVLDVATGQGHQASAFARKGHPVVGIDLVHNRAHSANGADHESRIKWCAGDASRLPFKDGAFDVVTISLALHSMPFDIQLHALREFQRVARKRVVILEPRPPKWWLSRHLYAMIGQVLDESLYFREFALRDFDAQLRHAGLKIRTAHRCYHRVLTAYVCDPVGII